MVASRHADRHQLLGEEAGMQGRAKSEVMLGAGAEGAQGPAQAVGVGEVGGWRGEVCWGGEGPGHVAATQLATTVGRPHPSRPGSSLRGVGLQIQVQLGLFGITGECESRLLRFLCKA